MITKFFKWYEAQSELLQVAINFVAIIIAFLIAARVETLF